MRAPARAAAAALLLLAAACLAAGQDANTYTVVPPPPDASKLPATRPPMWDFRVYSDSKISFKTFGSGAIEMQVVHKPLPNVSDRMMAWMFANLASGSAVSPIDNQTYPMFLLYHPRDHAKHTCSTKPCKNGAFTTFTEFPLTGCTGAVSPAGGKMTCPSGANSSNPGYVSTTPVDVWNATDNEKVNGNPRVNSLSNSRVAFYTRRCSNVGCGNVIQTTHAWKYDKKADSLAVTSYIRVGLAGYSPSTQRIQNGWRANFDLTDKFHRTALHFTEEIGGTRHWLPAAYNAANPQTGKRPGTGR